MRVSQLAEGVSDERPVVPPSGEESEAGPVTSVLDRLRSARAATWDRLGVEWRFAILLLVTMRVTLGVLGVMGLLLHPITVIAGDWTQLMIHSGSPWSLFLSEWQRWDALWYQHIVEQGYQPGNGSVNFPLGYPLTGKIASFIFLGNSVLGLLLASSVAYVVGMALVYRLAREHVSESAARLTVILMTLAPTGFSFFAPYTESLFLALTAGSLLLARRGRLWEAAAVAFAATLTRYLGVFLILPLAVEYVRHTVRAGRRVDLGLLLALSPLAGIGALMLFDRLVVGETRSIFEVSRSWASALVAPWDGLSLSLNWISAHKDVVELTNFVFLVGFFALSFVALRMGWLAYAAYALPYTFFLFTRPSFVSPFASDGRYVLVLFPVWMVIAKFLAGRTRLTFAAVIFTAMLQMLFFDYWTHFGYVL